MPPPFYACFINDFRGAVSAVRLAWCKKENYDSMLETKKTSESGISYFFSQLLVLRTQDIHMYGCQFSFLVVDGPVVRPWFDESWGNDDLDKRVAFLQKNSCSRTHHSPRPIEGFIYCHAGKKSVHITPITILIQILFKVGFFEGSRSMLTFLWCEAVVVYIKFFKVLRLVLLLVPPLTADFLEIWKPTTTHHTN